MRIIFLLGLLFTIACGETTGNKSTDHTPTPTPDVSPTVITEDQVIGKAWTAPVDGVFFVVHLEAFANAEGIMTNNFHFWVCETTDCSPELWFMRGTFAVESPNKLCFKNIEFYQELPERYQYQPVTKLSEYIYTTADFCATGVFSDSGKLQVTAKNEKGERRFDFESSPLPTY